MTSRDPNATTPVPPRAGDRVVNDPDGAATIREEPVARTTTSRPPHDTHAAHTADEGKSKSWMIWLAVAAGILLLLLLFWPFGAADDDIETTTVPLEEGAVLTEEAVEGDVTTTTVPVEPVND